MKLALFLWISFFFLCFCQITKAQSDYAHLWVSEPRQSWRSFPCDIEEASLTVKPHGIYTEIGMYLTFSAKSQPFSQKDSLEVGMNFTLPEGSIVHDSWLWINNEIIKADILDQWTASAIYEEIVSRRQDPSILKKISDNSYELRVFPMAAKESRKVKISYLVPAEWSSNNVTSLLPTNILNASNFPVNKVNIRVWLEEGWNNPQLLNFAGNYFKQQTDSVLGSFWEADIPGIDFKDNIGLMVQAPLNNGVYLSRFKESKVYQLVYFPNEALRESDLDNQKLAVLIDYNQAIKSRNVSTDQWLELIKLELINNLDGRDSFNVLISGLNVTQISDNWMPATKEQIELVFNDLIDNASFPNYNSLPALLGAGIKFVKQVGGGGILLFSNGTDEGKNGIANGILDDVVKAIGDDDIPINVADLQNSFFVQQYINGIRYYNNEYLYINLASLTAGVFLSSRNCCSSETQIVGRMFDELTAIRGSIDFHTTLKTGFCYERYQPGRTSTTSRNLNKPIFEVGKYNGNFPFIVDVAGELNGNIFQDLVEIEDAAVLNSDSLNQEMWVGQKIFELENSIDDNRTITEIIELSIKERVLSLYTAFLALEPSRGGEVCKDCQDESGGSTVAVDNSEELDSTIIVNIFPNPFNEVVTIEVDHDGKLHPEDLSLSVHNGAGQIVKSFSPQVFAHSSEVTFQWNGHHDDGGALPGGVYFLVLKTAKASKTMKLVYMPD